MQFYKNTVFDKLNFFVKLLKSYLNLPSIFKTSDVNYVYFWFRYEHIYGR